MGGMSPKSFVKNKPKNTSNFFLVKGETPAEKTQEFGKIKAYLNSPAQEKKR
jgi:hypothetical protein